jgi:hypothetical protein
VLIVSWSDAAEGIASLVQLGLTDSGSLVAVTALAVQWPDDTVSPPLLEATSDKVRCCTAEPYVRRGLGDKFPNQASE